MDRMADRALFLLIRLMGTFRTGLRLIMTGKTEGVGLVRGHDPFILHPVTAAALPFLHRIMYIFLKQHRPVTGMRGMTPQTAAPDRIVAVRFDKQWFFDLMTGATEGIRGLSQQRNILGRVGLMTGSTALLQGGVGIFFFKKAAFMTTETALLDRIFQQAWKTAVMRVMTAVARSGRHGLMDGFPV